MHGGQILYFLVVYTHVHVQAFHFLGFLWCGGFSRVLGDVSFEFWDVSFRCDDIKWSAIGLERFTGSKMGVGNVSAVDNL